MSKLILSLLAVVTLSGCVAPADESGLLDDEGEEEAGSAQQAVVGTSCSTMTADATSALAAINNVRTKMGMAAINCDNKIQQAAINHAKYQGLNAVMTHQEVAGKPGFTAVNFWERMTYTGFVGNAMNEVIGGGDGTGLVNQLMNSVYHRVPFASFQAKQYGFGNYISGSTKKYGTIDFASGGSPPSAITTVVWPSVNATGVPISFICTSESPNPCNAGQTTVGSPISLTGGSDLTITSTKIVKAGTTTGLSHLVRTNAFSGYIPKTQVYLIPNAAFTAATQYTATVAGSLNGTTFTRTWSFKTQ